MTNVIKVDFTGGEVQQGDVIAIPGRDGWFEVIAILGDKVEVMPVEDGGGPDAA